MEVLSRRPTNPRRSSVPRLSIIIKDSRFPDTKTIISPCSPSCSPRNTKNRNIATVVVMSPRLFSPIGTPTATSTNTTTNTTTTAKIMTTSSPAESRRGSQESTTSTTAINNARRASKTSINMTGRRRESIIYRNEQEYDSAIIEQQNYKTSNSNRNSTGSDASDVSMADDYCYDDEFPSTKSDLSPLVTRVRAYSISTKNSRRRAARALHHAHDPQSSTVVAAVTPAIVAGPRRRSSIVVVHNYAAPASRGSEKEFSEMPEESEDEA